MTFEEDYLDLLHYILTTGEERGDRTGTGTLAVFGLSMTIELSRGFPILSTKRVPFRSVLSELLWFIEGSGDERRLAEILHGTRDPEKKTIWSPNAEGTSGSAFKPSYDGDLGRVYGVQWRSWRHTEVKEFGDYLRHPDSDGTTFFKAKAVQTDTDQLAHVIHKLKTNPTDRRIIMTAWNPGELNQMALPPCHMFIQFYMTNDRTLHAQMYQRSVDTFLGLPFNISSYALLVHMIAHVVGAKPGNLSLVLGDTHIYKDHIDAVKMQLDREPSNELPTLVIKRRVENIDDFTMDDFELVGYNPQPTISARMSA